MVLPVKVSFRQPSQWPGPGHKPSFPKRSKLLRQSAYERQVYGEGTKPHFVALC
jgi:hypothetical protein